LAAGLTAYPDDIASHLCRRFGVSAKVIARRLRIEECWPLK
jgi:Zn-dependent peptidase ImmA (M78 family)